MLCIPPVVLPYRFICWERLLFDSRRFASIAGVLGISRTPLRPQPKPIAAPPIPMVSSWQLELVTEECSPEPYSKVSRPESPGNAA